MKTTIYFVRHAKPDFSIKEESIRPLTEQGMIDSKKITASLLDKEITAIYSSPYKRAYDTVVDFAESTELKIQVVDNFRERNVGEWVEDFQGFAKQQWSDFDYKLTEGEALREVQERNISALFDVLKQQGGKNIMVGTHGTALSTILHYFNRNFCYDDFYAFVHKMPYIIKCTFAEMKLETIEEVSI